MGSLTNERRVADYEGDTRKRMSDRTGNNRLRPCRRAREWPVMAALARKIKSVDRIQQRASPVRPEYFQPRSGAVSSTYRLVRQTGTRVNLLSDGAVRMDNFVVVIGQALVEYRVGPIRRRLHSSGACFVSVAASRRAISRRLHRLRY